MRGKEKAAGGRPWEQIQPSLSKDATRLDDFLERPSKDFVSIGVMSGWWEPWVRKAQLRGHSSHSSSVTLDLTWVSISLSYLQRLPPQFCEAWMSPLVKSDSSLMHTHEVLSTGVTPFSLPLCLVWDSWLESWLETTSGRSPCRLLDAIGQFCPWESSASVETAWYLPEAPEWILLRLIGLGLQVGFFLCASPSSDWMWN